MPKSPNETLAEFLAREDKSALVELLIDLAEANESVFSRLQEDAQRLATVAKVP